MSPSSDLPASHSPAAPDTLPESTGEATPQQLVAAPEAIGQDLLTETSPTDSQETTSYVKLAMRNMVRKRSKSLFHFFLTTIGLLGLLVGLSYLTR